MTDLNNFATQVGEDVGALRAAVPAITYHWDGTPHASQSVRRTAGQETGRNLISNPSFETGVAGVTGSNLVELGRTNLPSRVEHGAWALWPTVTQTTTTLTYVQQEAAIPPGAAYVAGRAMVMATNGSAGTARLRVSFGGGGTRLYEWMSVMRDVRAAQHVLHGAVEIPAGYTTVQLMLYLYGTGTELTEGSKFATDGWMLTAADTRDEALDGVRDYFDGDTPDQSRIDVIERRIAALEAATDPVDPGDAPEA